MAVSVRERVSTIPVERRGMFVLRYKSARDERYPPRLFVRSSPGFEDSLRIVTPPGLQAGLVPRPGCGLAILSDGAVSLQITVQTQPLSSGSTEVELNLDALDTPEELPLDVQARSPVPADQAPAQLAPAVSMLLHVSRRGDQVTRPGEWGGGPNSPLPVEGLELRWDGAAPCLLEYQVLPAGAQARWSDWVRAGEFAGSRGQARPLVGVRMRLSGGDASEYLIRIQGLFLGAPITGQMGTSVELIGPSASDPLLGLRFEIVRRSEAPPQHDRRDVNAEAASGFRQQTSQGVRVFRANRGAG